jgi:hypothetical protein
MKEIMDHRYLIEVDCSRNNNLEKILFDKTRLLASKNKALGQTRQADWMNRGTCHFNEDDQP